MAQPSRWRSRGSRRTISHILATASHRVWAEPLESRLLLSTTWFVATTGSNSAAGAGSSATPFQTIQAAANVAQPGDTVMIHAGTYRETVTPAHSGSAGAPITYQAAGDGDVTINGADIVSGFSSAGGAVFQTSANTWDLGEGANQVFDNGQMLFEARWPNTTTLDVSGQVFSHASSIAANTVGFGNYDVATLTDPALTQPSGYWVGGLIHIAPGQGWVVQAGRVLSSQPGSLTYEYEQMNTPYEVPSGGNPYYLSGKFQALDSAGEFYRDPTTNTLYLETVQGTNPSSDTIEVKHRNLGFDLTNASYIHLTGVRFFATTVSMGASTTGNVLDGISAFYSSQYTSIANGWRPPSPTGIQVRGTGNSVINSNIQYSSGNGIYVLGTGNTIENNNIRDVDYAGYDAAGVYTWGSGQVVGYNTIFDAGRDGIHLSHSTQTQVLNNEIFNVMLQTTDGGGIYTYGTDGTGSRIAYNRIYNIHSGGYGAAGIYLDNFDSNYLVDHNVSFNNTMGIKLNPPSSNERIYNNTFYQNSQDIGSSGSLDMSGSVFENNIFSDSLLYGSNATLLRNIYQGTNPLLSNPGGGDFTLQAGSPAIDNGADLGTVTSGFSGAGPDIGAFEFGSPPVQVGSPGIGTTLGNLPTLPAPVTTLPPVTIPSPPAGGGLPPTNVTPAPTGSGGAGGPPTPTTGTGGGVITRDPEPPATVVPVTQLPPGAVPPAGTPVPGATGGTAGTTPAGTVPTVSNLPPPTVGTPVTVTPTPTPTPTGTTPTPTPTGTGSTGGTGNPGGPVTVTPAPYIPPVSVGAGVTVPAGISLPPGSVLPGGSFLPAGTTLLPGTVLPAGTVITSGTVFPVGTVFPAGTVIAAGTVFPQGTILPFGTVLPLGTVIPPGVTLPAGLTILPGQSAPAGLPAGVYFPPGTVIPSGTVFPPGTVITYGTTLPEGAFLPFGGAIASGTVMPAGFSLSVGSTLPMGTVLPAGTVIPALANTYQRHRHRHLKAHSRIAANSFDAASRVGLGGHRSIDYTSIGGWAEYSQVNFGKKGVKKFTASFAGDSQYSQRQIEIHVDGPDGPLLGTLNAASTGSPSRYRTQSTTVHSVTGVHDLYLVFARNEGTAHVTNFKFS